MEYVVGFVFSNNSSHVLLLEKTYPEWQQGKLNGVGGKIISGETALQGIYREFVEETGITIEDWTMSALLFAEDITLYVFKARSDKIYDINNNLNDVGEQLKVVSIDEFNNLRAICIYNIQWLVHMCLDDTVDKAFILTNSLKEKES